MTSLERETAQPQKLWSDEVATMGICKGAKAWSRRVKMIKELHLEEGQNYGAVNRFEDGEAAQSHLAVAQSSVLDNNVRESQWRKEGRLSKRLAHGGEILICRKGCCLESIAAEILHGCERSARRGKELSQMEAPKLGGELSGLQALRPKELATTAKQLKEEKMEW